MFFFFSVFSVHLCTNPLLCFSSAQYVQNDSPSSKSLAGLIVQLLQFQEDAFGRRVNNPALTKLPVRHTLLIKTKNRWRLLNPHCCSATFRPNASLISRREALSVTSWGLSTSLRASRGGELMIFLFQTFLKSTFTSDVFKGCLKIHLSTSSLSLRRRFDLQNPSRMDRNVEMFLNVEKNLVQVPSDKHIKLIWLLIWSFLCNYPLDKLVFFFKTFLIVSCFFSRITAWPDLLSFCHRISSRNKPVSSKTSLRDTRWVQNQPVKWVRGCKYEDFGFIVSATFPPQGSITDDKSKATHQIFPSLPQQDEGRSFRSL